MMTQYHNPVLLEDALQGLDIRPEGIYVDVTFGGGFILEHFWINSMNKVDYSHLIKIRMHMKTELKIPDFN